MADPIVKLIEKMIDPIAADRFQLMGDALDDAAWVDFTEIRPALELREPMVAGDTTSVGLTSREIDIAAAIGNRDYDAFYVRFKQAVFAGIWGYLVTKTSHPNSTTFFHQGQGVYEADAASGTIHRTTVDGDGNTISIDATYDAHVATDNLLLYLPADFLADFADIYYSIQSLSSANAYFLRTEFFATVERFWFERSSASASSATSDFRKEGAISGLAQGVAPLPYVVETLEGLWADCRELLIDRYGEGGEDLGTLIDQYTFRPGPVPLSWPFAVSRVGDVNVGLRLVYRQEWRHLGNQRGEVIRTIPLGPKQAERVSTKIVRRTKMSRSAEDLRSVEKTSEKADTTKTSSEVVEEAAKSMKWHVNTEIEGSINVGIYSLAGKTDMGLQRESRESSRDTSTRLSETMQKVASKLRTETKVVVSTETEETFESTSATDIQNPNDEIALTYVYSKLQNQYEVLTRLAEIQNVVMVAEAIPSPAEIDFDWVKRHDWILAKVLLDDSFREALSSISQEARSPDSSMVVSDLQSARDKTIEHFGTFARTPNVRAENIDMIVESQRAYRESAKEQLERLKLNFELDAKRDRLLEHIRSNILYYCRAIWSQEDPQQRSLRYKKAGYKVPLEWRFEPLTGVPLTVDQFVATLTTAATNGYIDGRFVAYAGGREADLHEVINPAGPIGYYGNYALYYMRPEFASGELFSMLHFFKAPYLEYNAVTQREEVMDPLQIQLAKDNPEATILDKTIDESRDDMLRYVPDLRLALAKARRQEDDDIDPTATTTLLNNRALFKKYYAEFLFRREQSRRFVVDTNSLVMDIIPGDGSALEQFKRVHRGIDALRAVEEKRRLSVENDRREGLLQLPNYSDPDVERIIVVDQNGAGMGSVVGSSIASRR